VKSLHRSIIAAVFLPVALANAAWITDYDEALSKARADDKLVLVDFTGSDWCGWCMRLKAQVFDTADFAAFAEANLVLVEVDFPRRKALPEQQRINNSILQNKFRVQGYPTVAIVNGAGRQLGELGYVPGGPAAFIAELKKIRGTTWKDPAPGAAPAPPPAASRQAPAEEAPWGGLKTPPKYYSDLKLTGLSGTAARRFAMINNQTFSAGETARVKLKDAEVKVLCKEIRASSVVIQVDGAEPKELFFGK